jgi:hypothetical protein
MSEEPLAVVPSALTTLSTGVPSRPVFAAPAYSMTINRSLGKVRPSRSTRSRSTGLEHCATATRLGLLGDYAVITKAGSGPLRLGKAVYSSRWSTRSWESSTAACRLPPGASGRRPVSMQRQGGAGSMNQRQKLGSGSWSLRSADPCPSETDTTPGPRGTLAPGAPAP